DGVSIPAVSMKLDIRIISVKLCQKPGDHIHSYRFAAADKNISTQMLGICMKSGLCIFQKFHNLLRTVTKEYPVFRQFDASFSADKELLSKLAFQIHHLPGKGRLGNKQCLSRLCNIQFSCYCKKIMEQS